MVRHRRGERERLAARAGAEIDNVLAALGPGGARDALAAAVLDLEPALAKGR